MRKNILFTILFFILIGCVSCENKKVDNKLVVASYNIRYKNDGDAKNGNGWDQRCPVIVDLLRFNNFDIWGAQEVLYPQLNDLLAGLPEYSYIGVGRDDGKTEGEYAPIFYKKDKFDLLKSGHFWLSEQTDHPNKGWDAVLPRICTWGEFQDKETKKNIWFFNLHMDHVGVQARSESARLVLNKIQEMCNIEDIVVFTGDFNVDQTNESYKLIHNSDLLDDSYEITQNRYATNGTFNAFNANLKTDSRIDHIFVSPRVTVERYAILTDSYRGKIENSESIKDGNFPKEVSLEKYIARLPSDHFPVRVELIYQ